ncbi:hypothetical protein BDV97DRAFT_87804 [Delphinella strobiligena]|nr:hypothetical protein BDV97DRAFT_87804 [Delphinella strobiligena]
MGSHTFTWPHAAKEVFVTGTFDNWQKTVKLEAHGNVFHKTVDLPSEKILYKFVVDGNWTTDHTAAQEQDHQGIYNNILTPDELKSAPSSHSFLSSAAPTSTTAAMAGEVPIHKNDREERDEVPGAFPETPANELNQFNVDPIPATSSNPIPGGAGASNPIKLAPGESVPHPSTYTTNTVDSTVSHDATNHKRGSMLDEAHGTRGTQITHPAEEAERALGVAPLPATAGIGNPIKLAPGEPVPDPSTFTNNTLHSTVGDMRSESGAPQLPPFTPGTTAEANGDSMFALPEYGTAEGSFIPESSLPMGTAAGAGHAASSQRDTGATISSVAPESTTAALAAKVPIRARGVPEVVIESEQAAHQSPEAAAYTEPVEQKSAVEEELMSKVPEARGIEAVGQGNAEGVPATVTESQHRADVDPEAASSPVAVGDKAAVEEELKQKVPEEPATSSSGIFGASEGGITGAIAGGALAAGGAIAAAAYAARDKAPAAIDQASKYANQYGGALGEKAQPYLDQAHDYAEKQAGHADESSTTTATGTTTHTVPSTVLDSQQAAHVSPEAAAEPEVVGEKAAMENELRAKVPEEPATSESGILGKSEQGITGKAAAGIAAGTAAATAAVAGITGHAEDESVPTSTAMTTNTVPSTVLHSQEAAHVCPEASAEPEVVSEKAAMEKELQAKVPEEPATSESGLLGKSEQGLTGKAAAGIAAGTAAAGAAVAGYAYEARDKTSAATGVDKHTILPPSIASAIDSMNNKGTTAPTSPNGFNSTVPEEVIESQKAAHFSPEASANPEAVAEKSQVEKELLREVETSNASGEPAPTASAALSATAPGTVHETSLSSPEDSFAGAPSEGLNAGANSQAQSLFTKTAALAGADEPVVDSTPATGNIADEPSTETTAHTSTLTESANKEPASAQHIAERALGAESSTLGASTVVDDKAVAEPKEKSLFDPKSGGLAAPELGNSRDVSPMSKTPRAPEDQTTGLGSVLLPQPFPKVPSRPQLPHRRGRSRSATASSRTLPSRPNHPTPLTPRPTRPSPRRRASLLSSRRSSPDRWLCS